MNVIERSPLALIALVMCGGFGFASTRTALEADHIVFESRLYQFKIEVELNDEAKFRKVEVTIKGKQIAVPIEDFKECGEVYLESMRVYGLGAPDKTQTMNFEGSVEIVFDMEPSHFNVDDAG